MILCHQTPWKNTLAFRISFDLRNLNIHQTHPALLHFAEHLIFGATKKFTEQALYEKKNISFDLLDAFTTPHNVCINVSCAKSDLKLVTEAVREMMYSWKCSEKQFNNEKKEILTELAQYVNEPITKAVNKLSVRDPELKTFVIGSKKTLTALTYLDLKKIKEAWQIMLDKAPISLIVASGNLTTAEKKLLENIADFKRPITPIPPIPFSAQFLSVPDVNAIQFKTTLNSPFYLLLKRLYYTRSIITNPTWLFELIHEENSLTYLTCKGLKEDFDKNASKKFLLTPPTKAEFNTARDIIVNHIDTLQDGIEPENLLSWIDTFYLGEVPTTQNKDLSEITNLFKAYSFENFVKEWKQKISLLSKSKTQN